MKLDKDTFDRWIKWTEKIQSDLTEIVNNKQIYDYFIELINANLEHIKQNNGILFCDFVRRCYAVQAAVGIRRHTKLNDDSISLMKLLEQMKKCAIQLTYDFYLKQYPINSSDSFEWQKSTFRNFSKDGRIISENIIDKDMQQLREIGGKVSNFVDRAMAHMDKRGYSQEVTYGDLAQSIELFNEIACKYITFITSKGLISLRPTIQFDWQQIFTVPLDNRKFGDEIIG